MNVLPDRPYFPRQDKTDRERLLPYGARNHPAKMYISLALDLVVRYTRPGQHILDPCYGVGTTGVALLKGRHVTGIELEPHHHRDALANTRHLERIARDFGKAGGGVVVLGDAREQIPWLVNHAKEAVITSSAFGEMNAPHRGGDITQRPTKDGKDFEGNKEQFVYGGHDQPPVEGTIFSPAYLNENTDSVERRDTLRSRMEQTQGRRYTRASMNDSMAYGQDAAPEVDGTLFSSEFQKIVDAHILSPAYGTQMPDQGDPQVGVERIKRKVEAGELTHPEGTAVGRRTAWGGGQVRSYTHGYGADVDANLTSPAYGEVASRDRHLEPFAQKDPERAAKYGQDSPSRNVSGYGKNEAQIGNMKLPEYQQAMAAIYARCLDVTRPGGVLVTVTGNYISEGKIIDLAALTIDLCVAAGWTPVERWRAVKRNKNGSPSVSFWRTTQAKQGMPLIDYEDVLVFCKGEQPGWDFAPLSGGWPG